LGGETLSRRPNILVSRFAMIRRLLPGAGGRVTALGRQFRDHFDSPLE
jgi:hypothetical protein